MAVTITVLYTVYIAFHNSAERVNTQIDHAFKSAITEDYNEKTCLHQLLSSRTYKLGYKKCILSLPAYTKK
mgnify:CR=1 FL=1